jgi:uncharacterized protein YkwD
MFLLLHRSIMMALLMLLATPAAAEWRLPCLLGLLGGCSSVTLVPPEYAAGPVQPLDPQAALAEINAFRAKYGRHALVLDARLSRAATMQSKDQAGRGSIGHRGSDGSTIMDRAKRAGYHPRIVAENVSWGHKSFSEVMYVWETSSSHRKNLLLPNVGAVGVAMAKSTGPCLLDPCSRQRD